MSNGGTIFGNNRARRCSFAALALWFAAFLFAGADPIKIEFLPPPMEGTLSLGIYDNSEKLVRVLYREAETSELVAGDDGLIAQWDGKDDKGAPCPPGIYRARGVMVGDLEIDGVDFIGNDWVTSDDSPRLRKITGLGISDKEIPFIAATLLGQTSSFYYSILLKKAEAPSDDFETQLVLEPQKPPVRVYKARIPQFLKPSIPWVYGFNSSIWAIEEKAINQYSATGRLIRTIPLQPDDPVASKLTASNTEEKVYVLYESATIQRLRGYDFTGVKPGNDPKVLFENDILASDTFEQIASELKFPSDQPFAPSPSLTVPLVANPLFHNKPGSLQIKVDVDKTGCFLATTEGLPLCHISDTKNLRWAVMGQSNNSKEITVFDCDGAVVEEFKISKIANMMAFDAGVIQWTTPINTSTPAATGTPSPAVLPTASPSPTPQLP